VDMPVKQSKEIVVKSKPHEQTELIEIIYANLDLKEPHSKRFIAQILENIRLFDKKQHDYGPGNIEKFMQTGVMIRLSDKLERLINLWKKDSTSAECEAVMDTWADISNYGAIGQMCLSGEWAKHVEDKK